MYFTYIATVLLAFMFLIWSRDGIWNVAIKFMFMAAMIFGIVDSLIYMGVFTHAVI